MALTAERKREMSTSPLPAAKERVRLTRGIESTSIDAFRELAQGYPREYPATRTSSKYTHHFVRHGSRASNVTSLDPKRRKGKMRGLRRVSTVLAMCPILQSPTQQRQAIYSQVRENKFWALTLSRQET